MKIIVISLEILGCHVSIHLANSGNEVITVDRDPEKVDQIKDKVAHAVIMDATSENAYSALPLKNADLAVIAIGQRNGAGILSAAIVKKLTKANIIARSTSDLEDTILEAMGIEQIIHPEQEFAERLMKKINLKGSIDNFEIDDDYLLSEVKISSDLVGRTLKETNFRNAHKLNIITIIRTKKHFNLMGRAVTKREVVGLPDPELIFEEGDILAVFGKDRDIKKYLKAQSDKSTD